LLVANTLNIAADIAAMGETAELVGGVSRHVMIALFVAVTLLLQIFIPYHRYVFFLKWLTLSLLAYAAVLFAVHVPWGETLRQTVFPHFRLDGAAATMIVAIFGTTISPYLLFWQASEEIEDMRDAPPLREDPSVAKAELSRIGWDTWSGMLYSNLASYFIILATGVTLHAAGITQIDTAAEAAAALRPLSGAGASIVFAAGILGVGFIGVPVLAGSAGYALCEAMGWKWGLDRKATDARAFYTIIAVSVLLALALQFLPISPMRALFWSAVINGVVAIPLIVVLMVLVSRTAIMGAFTASRPLIWLAGLAAGLMGAAAVVMVAGFF
jgi:Mn2+/Fe2+ NRAMP family transporter